MEYHVVYSSNHYGGAENDHHKRKRYEKTAPQIDGILLLQNVASEISSSQRNINKQATPMMVTLYNIKQSEGAGSDDASSSSDDQQVGNNVYDEDDIHAENENDLSLIPKKGSWKDRQNVLSRQKSKRTYKKMKTNTRRKNNDHSTSKKVVYSGSITQWHSICGTNKDTNITMTSAVPASLSVDDTLILGSFKVHVIGSVSSGSNSGRDDTLYQSSNKENSTENTSGPACSCSIVVDDLPSDVVISKCNNIKQSIHNSCHSIALQKAPVRRIVSVPLQSKHNIKKADTSIRKFELNPKQHSIQGISNVGTNTKVLHNRPMHQTTFAKTTPVVPKKYGTNTLPSLSTNSIVKKSIPLPIKPLHQSTMRPHNSNPKTYTVAKILPHISLPASIRAVLRPHQVQGVEFIWRTLNEKKGCILGDEMGLGKTLMTIACISAIHRTHREKQFVVVCPSTLVVNWSNEFDKWLGPASQPKRVTIQEGGAEGLQQIRTFMQKTNQQIKHQPGQVLIISYEFFRRNVNIFDCKGYVSVGLLVVDEGHRLKNAGDSRTFTALASLPTDGRLCITATPIQNNLCEFFNLADFCCPGILGPNVSFFRKNYERPIAATSQKNATRQQLILGSAKSKELDMIAKTFMIRRLQKDVLKAMLPPRTEALLFCRPTKVQCKLYRSACSSINLSNISDALTTLITLRKICAHPVLDNNKDCREAKHGPHVSEVLLSGKMIVLHNLLQQIREGACSDKVVIVSNFTSVLSLVERLILQPCSYTYLRLDGTTKDRQALVDTFNRTSVDRSFCFLLSSKAGGCGLNIVGANRLIMFDADWNPATCQQAMGRIYRQGQTKSCMIYRLFTSGTVEEVILQRQMMKRGLLNLKADSHNETEAKFSKEELAGCFDLKENSICDTKEKLGANWPCYDVSGLHSLECNDEPLLKVASKIPQSLCFIHISIDGESIPDNDLQDQLPHACSQVGYESEEEENEFTL